MHVRWTVVGMTEVTAADRLLRDVFEKDTSKRLQAGADLLKYLQDEANSIFDFDQLDKLVDGLTSWVNSSNPKVPSSCVLPQAEKNKQTILTLTDTVQGVSLYGFLIVFRTLF